MSRAKLQVHICEVAVIPCQRELSLVKERLLGPEDVCIENWPGNGCMDWLGLMNWLSGEEILHLEPDTLEVVGIVVID